MVFEFNATVNRRVEEEISIVVDAQDEVEAEEMALELIESHGRDTKEIARRYLVERRYYGTPDEIELKQIVYEEGPRYA